MPTCTAFLALFVGAGVWSRLDFTITRDKAWAERVAKERAAGVLGRAQALWEGEGGGGGGGLGSAGGKGSAWGWLGGGGRLLACEQILEGGCWGGGRCVKWGPAGAGGKECWGRREECMSRGGGGGTACERVSDGGKGGGEPFRLCVSGHQIVHVESAHQAQPAVL